MRRSTSILRTSLAALAVVAACASAPARPQLRDADYPGVLRAPESLPFDVVWQQRVTAFWGDGQQRGFDAAIQKQGDKLTVLGLSPMGSVGFSIVMQGDHFEVHNHTERDLPFPPRFILLDVQRAFYPWLLGQFAEREGRTIGPVDDEQVAEIRVGGRLTERRFRRLDKPDADIVVRYTFAEPGWRGPTRVEFDNQWFGYRLQIDTHAETLLSATDGEGR